MHNLKKSFRKICEKNPVYAFSLWNRDNLDFSKIPPDPWPVNKNFDINALYDEKVWNDFYFQSFEWIKEFKNDPDFSIRAKIREIILYWIKTFHTVLKRSWLNWDCEMTGYRLWNWITLFDFYGVSGSETFRKVLTKSLSQQAKHLLRAWDDSNDPLKQFRALKGLIGFFAISNPEKIKTLLGALEENINAQIFEDGGHKNRNPLTQIILLRDLVDIRSALSRHQINSEFIRDKIIQVAPIVRLFRHGDGTLARFIGTTENKIYPFTPPFIDMCLSISDVSRRPPTDAYEMGYLRCINKSGILIFSTKPQKPQNFATGLFNFEWSYDRQIIFSSVDTIIEKNDKTYFEANIDTCVEVERQTNDDCVVIQGQFKNEHLEYARRIEMSDKNASIRGEDKIQFDNDRFAAIRFTMAPDIEILPDSQTTKSLILKLNAFNVNNVSKLSRITTLQLIATGCHELIYQPKTEIEPHAIILLACLDAGKTTTIKWSLTLHV